MKTQNTTPWSAEWEMNNLGKSITDERVAARKKAIEDDANFIVDIRDIDHSVADLRVKNESNIAYWYVTEDGDILENRQDADDLGLANIIISDSWYPGSINEWKGVIRAKAGDRIPAKVSY